MKSKSRNALLLSATLLFAFGRARDPRLMPPGFQDVLKDTQAAFEQLGAATIKVDEALNQCAALAEGDVESPPAAKGELEESIAKLEDLSNDLQSAVEKMDDRANEFFKKWEDSFEHMSEIDRVSSMEMRDDLWKRYRTIADDGANSEVELRPVITDLKSLLERFDGETDVEGSKSRQKAFDELSAKTVTWLEDVRRRYRDAEKELRALEREMDDEDSPSPDH